MQKENEKFLTMAENEEVYKDELQADIEAKEEELTLLDGSYKQALTNDDDKKADKLQDDIYNLKKVVQRNNDKLDLLTESSGSKSLHEQANLVLVESNQAIDNLNVEAKAIADRYHTKRQELIDIVIELQEHQKKATPYQHAVNRVIKLLPDWAKLEAETNKPRSKVSWTQIPNRKGIGRYSNTVGNPQLKELNDTQIRRAQAGMSI